GHRFERTVDPRTIDFAAARCAALILDVAGGERLDGFIDRGAKPAPKTVISLRPRRVDQMLGVLVPPAEIMNHLEALQIRASLEEDGERLRCVVPPHRPDLTREIDLVEEIARIQGLDHIPIEEKMHIEVTSLQTDE